MVERHMPAPVISAKGLDVLQVDLIELEAELLTHDPRRGTSRVLEILDPPLGFSLTARSLKHELWRPRGWRP
jgi:hypothetical protein